MSGKIIVKFLCENPSVYKLALFINGSKQVEKIGRGEEKAYSIDKESEVYAQLGTIGGLKSNSIRIPAEQEIELVCSLKVGAWKNTLELSIAQEKVISDFEEPKEIEKHVFDFDGGVGDKLTVFEDRIVIKHKGALNFMAMGIHGDKTIYYSDLTSIQYKAGGILAGHIQFSLLGGNESRGGVLSAASDENTITFNANKNAEAQKICDYLNNKLKEIKNAKNTPVIQTAQLSAADELKQFKDLLDIGAITQEEFDAKKKQLLGL